MSGTPTSNRRAGSETSRTNQKPNIPAAADEPDLARPNTPESVPNESGKNWEVGYCKPPLHSRFKPGVAANPAGRPKGRSLTDILRAKLAESPKAAEDFVDRVIELAMEGQAPYAKEVWERMDGKVPDKLETVSEVIVQVVRDAEDA